MRTNCRKESESCHVSRRSSELPGVLPHMVIIHPRIGHLACSAPPHTSMQCSYPQHCITVVGGRLDDHASALCTVSFNRLFWPVLGSPVQPLPYVTQGMIRPHPKWSW